MRTRTTTLTAIVAASALLALPASAITFGTPDGYLHPNVGAMLVPQPDGSLADVCTGTLVAPRVFLTAAHCVAWMASAGIAPDEVWVTFEPVVDAGATLYHGFAVANPAYGSPRDDPNDVAVILLDEVVEGIAPARLPPMGLLDAMQAAHLLKAETFVTVGYGTLRVDKRGGPHALADSTERFSVEQSFLALLPYWIQLSMNPSTGSGGTCYGDSGGPHFIGETDVIAAITVTGDVFCRALDQAYRLDTGSARWFLGQFVELP